MIELKKVVIHIMLASSFKSNHHSPIYRKAMEIFHLARHISTYISYDLAPLQRNGQEDPNIYFSGDIVQQSISLGPNILMAESQSFQDEKHKYATSVMQLSNRLYKSCMHLQKTHSNGKDFLPIMIQELRKFRKLQNTWRLTL